MKSKGLLITVLGVGVLAALSFWDYKREEKEESKKEDSSRLFSLKFDQINEFEIKRSGENSKEDKITLKRSTNGWELLAPVQDIASDSEVENFLKEMIEEKSLDLVKEGDSISWSDYKLDKPKATITIKDQSGKSESLDISEMTNFENRQYARRGQEKRVLTVGASFKTRAGETNIRFRERKLFRGKLSEVHRLQLLQNSKEVLNLEKMQGDGPGLWISKQNKDLKIDQNKVRELLTQVAETKISNYLVNGRPSEVEKRNSNYLKTTGRLILETADKVWSVDLSLNAQKDLYAITSEPAFLVKVEPGQWEKFEKMNIASLVDVSEFFAFDQKTIESVIVKKGKTEVVYTKKGEGWESKASDEKSKPNPKYVEELMKSLATISLKEISKQSKFSSIQTSVDIKGPGGISLLSIEQGILSPGTKAVKTSKSKSVLVLNSDLAL